MYHIKIADQEIKTTAPHPFYVIGKGWVEAEDLVVGDHLKMANGETIKVEAITIETLKEPIKVYNFEVEDWHVYYVSDMEILVHNKGGPCSADYMAKEFVEGGSTTQTFLNKALKNQGLDSVPNKMKEVWIEGDFKYTIRVHEGNSAYTNAESIYRVSRQSTVPDANG